MKTKQQKIKAALKRERAGVTFSLAVMAIKKIGSKTAKKTPPGIKSVTVIDKVSTEVVIASLEKQAAPALRRVLNLSIKTKADYELAAETIKALKALSAEAKRQEQEITEPLKGVIKKTQNLFRPFQDKVNETELITKEAMGKFLESQKKIALKLDEDFGSGKIKKISTIVTKQNELKVTNGAAQVRKVWTLFVDDTNKIPREYMVPDLAAIREAYKNGTYVEGCRWEQVETIAI